MFVTLGLTASSAIAQILVSNDVYYIFVTLISSCSYRSIGYRVLNMSVSSFIVYVDMFIVITIDKIYVYCV